jgi:hypothetical protein
MENLIIKIFDSAKSKPDQVITIPISKINIGKKLLPVKAQNLLDREAIDISKISDLSNKSISKGSLIEIDSGKEKIIISVDE